jgi:redox-sensing transcriptional repressor
MSKRGHVSLSVIRRLPRYYRFLGDLMRIGFSRISSQELSQRMGFTASQIRQDLNCFGGFGQQGYGYNVDLLHSELGTIMGTDMAYPIIIIGAGNIGRALAMNIDFSAMGFRLSAIFDNNPAVIGTSIAGAG